MFKKSKICSTKVPPPAVITHHGNNANYTPLGPGGPGNLAVAAAAVATAQGEELISGRGFDNLTNFSSADSEQQSNQPKKVPYAKPIPKNFQQSWNEVGALTASSEGQQNFSQAPPPPMGGAQFPHAPPGMLPPPGPDCIPLQGRISQTVHIDNTRGFENL